jgi:acetyl esterase/lipase
MAPSSPAAHRSPTSALEDVEAGFRYSQAAGPVVVAGERLGAGLAAALLVRLRDAGAARPRGAILVSGLLDLTMRAPSLLLHQPVLVTGRAGAGTGSWARI